MSVVGTAVEIPDGQGTSVDAPDGQLSTRHSRVFRVKTSSRSDRESVVLSAPGLPYMYQPHPTNLLTLATGFRASRIDGHGQRWNVAVSYTQFSSLDDRHVEPFSRRPRIEWDTETFQRPLLTIGLREADEGFEEVQKRIANSAGEVFSPPPMEEVYREVVTFNYASSFFDTDIARKYGGAMNSDRFMNHDPKTAKCRRIRTPGVTAWKGPDGQEVLYYPITVIVAFAPEGETWERKHLDFGSYELIGDEKHVFKDAEGHPIHKRLDGFGSALADDDPDAFVDLPPPISLPFSKLALPGSEPGGVAGA